MAHNYNYSIKNLKWKTEIKYKTFRIDIKNRNDVVILTHYFCVLQKSLYPIHSPYDYPSYIEFDRLTQGKLPVYSFLLNRGGKLEIIDNFGDKLIDDRLVIKSVNDIDFWLSDSEDAAIEKIKEAHDHHMNNIPYAADLRFINEQ